MELNSIETGSLGQMIQQFLIGIHHHGNEGDVLIVGL